MVHKKSVIKLLFLLPTYTFGGAERTSLNLLNGIDKSRFRICLVTSKNIYQNFQNIDIEKFLSIEDLGMGVWFNSLRRFMHDMKKVVFLLKTEKPDIAFGMMHYPSSLLVFAKKLYGLDVKVIVSPRGPSTEYLKYFEKKFFRKIYLKGIFSFFCKYADGLVIASHGMKEECIRHFHADSARTIVIPNSVDFYEIKIKAEENIDIDIPSGFQLISTSGRLEREKNIPFLLKAFSLIRKTEKIRLMIIGDGTERKNLERLSRELNIEEDVVFVGYQGNPYKFIKRSDIFVHTCLFEGFANSIIEAMACGVPVITVDCPYGPKDIIKHGENGYLVPMNDEEALIRSIKTLLHDRALRISLAQRGSERALDFSTNTMVENYENFFKLMQG
jgi:glycosyltransferase involved in cell wall biosynthesis